MQHPAHKNFKLTALPQLIGCSGTIQDGLTAYIVETEGHLRLGIQRVCPMTPNGQIYKIYRYPQKDKGTLRKNCLVGLGKNTKKEKPEN